MKGRYENSQDRHGRDAVHRSSIAATVWAQDGVITGRVTDPSGAVLPGVNLSLDQHGGHGGAHRGDRRAGRLPVRAAAAGHLHAEVRAARASTRVVREGIQLTAGFTSTLNVVMDVGAVSETITVVGASPLIDVTNAIVSTTFTEELTAVLPTGHDVFSVLAVTPGVQLTAPDVGGSRAGLRAQFRVFGSTSQWNVIEGAIMASLQYEDPDVYQEVQVAGASKGADAPVGGSFNNFIVKSGGNSLRGLVFYDREPLALQGSNLTPELVSQGVTNTSSVARYQSFHGDVGGPIVRDKLWWFYGFRNLNSDNWTPGYVNTQTGQPVAAVHDAAQPRDEAELPAQLEQHAGLLRAVQQQVAAELRRLGVRRFGVDVADRFPVLDPGRRRYTSVLSNRSTLEVKWGEFGWRWWTRPGLDEIAREDLDTRLMRGGRQSPFVDRSHHMNISGVWSLNTSGTRVGDHTMRIGYGYLYEGAPYTFLAPKDSIKTFWRGGFRTPAEIETYDTPFSFENEVTHQWAFVNDTWNVGRLAFNGGFRVDSFLPYYEEQGKKGSGPYQAAVTYPGFSFHRLNGVVPRASVVYDVFGTGRTAIKAAYGRYNYNAGTMTNANSMMAGFVNPMARTTRRYRWDGTLPFVPDPANLLSTSGGPNRSLDPNLKLPYTDEFVAGIDQQIVERHDGPLQLRAQVRTQPDEADEHRHPVRGLQHPGQRRSTAAVTSRRPPTIGSITVYSLDRQYLGRRADLLTNDPVHRSDFRDLQRRGGEAPVQPSQLLTGFDVSHYDTWSFASAIGQDIATDTGGGPPQDPNRAMFNNLPRLLALAVQGARRATSCRTASACRPRCG